jgi:hypothetical protein
MTLKWVLIATVAMALVDSSQAAARQRRAAAANPCTGTLSDIFRLSCPPERRWNGKAPPVYANGVYVGQDPDPNIRFQLLREYLSKTDPH